MTCPFAPLKETLKIGYSGEGNRIAREFYIPVLKRSTNYYRLSGYFSVDSLAITAAGLVGLIANEGRMKLVVGAHDLGPEIVKAYELSRDKAASLLNEIGKRIVGGLENVEDLFMSRRLEALAWMLANGSLEVCT